MATTPVIARRGRARKSIPPPSPGVINGNAWYVQFAEHFNLILHSIEQELNQCYKLSESLFFTCYIITVPLAYCVTRGQLGIWINTLLSFISNPTLGTFNAFARTFIT